jgi:hypothetical protein
MLADRNGNKLVEDAMTTEALERGNAYVDPASVNAQTVASGAL